MRVDAGSPSKWRATFEVSKLTESSAFSQLFLSRGRWPAFEGSDKHWWSGTLCSCRKRSSTCGTDRATTQPLEKLGVGAPGRTRTCDLLLRSRAASSPFSTCVPIVSSPLHQFREPAFAQRQNLFSCNYIRSERVLLRLCYVQKCGGIYQCVRPTRASATRWRSSGR